MFSQHPEMRGGFALLDVKPVQFSVPLGIKWNIRKPTISLKNAPAWDLHKAVIKVFHVPFKQKQWRSNAILPCCIWYLTCKNSYLLDCFTFISLIWLFTCRLSSRFTHLLKHEKITSITYFRPRFALDMNHYLRDGKISKQNSNPLYHFIFKPCVLMVLLHTDFQERFILTNLSTQRFKIPVFYLPLSE